MHTWPDLREILKVDWVIVDGVATRAYMPERMTQDLDILVSSDDGQKALKQLQSAGYIHIAALAIPGHHLRSPEGIDVDLLLGSGAWVGDALKQTSTDPAGYPVLSLPYLVLLKLESSRAQDVADISRMLGSASEADLNEVRSVIAKYSPQDSEDLESLIFIGKQEWNS